MVDEDFVMGYCVGYNDGVGSGGGSGGEFDNIPLLKKYSFVGTDYGIGIVDSNNEMFNVPYNFPNYSIGKNIIFCPYPSTEHRRVWLAVLKNNVVVGLIASRDDLATHTPYQYSGTIWQQVGTVEVEKIENAFIEIVEKIYNNGSLVIQTLTFKYDICEYWDQTLKSTSTNTHELVEKSKSGTSYGSQQFISSDILGINKISNDHLRGFLFAWANCTGIEEV